MDFRTERSLHIRNEWKLHISTWGDRMLSIVFQEDERWQATPRGERIALVRFLLQEALRFAQLAFVEESEKIALVEAIPYDRGIVLFASSLQMQSIQTCIETNQHLILVALQTFESNEIRMDQNEADVVHIPVCYDPQVAPDLDEMAERLAVERETIISWHIHAEYYVQMIGFMPGFAYLGGLDPRLHLARKTTPRSKVNKGAVAIGGPYTGIYPFESPGGWHWIGQTPAYESRLKWGDRVRFERIEWNEFERLQAAYDLAQENAARTNVDTLVENGTVVATLQVLSAGLQSTVQDQGRAGYRAIGASVGGAMDPIGMRIANRIVGNDATAPVLEITFQGPHFRCLKSTRIGWFGPPIAYERAGQSCVWYGGWLDLQENTEIRFGRMLGGARGYLSIVGGWHGEKWLDSYSTALRVGRGGVHGRALQKDDVLFAPATGQGRAFQISNWHVSGHFDQQRWVVRVYFAQQMDAHRDVMQNYEMLSASDRMGIRLKAEHPLRIFEHTDATNMESVPVTTGTIQVPPDGQPIILMADAQPTGGYPVLGHVIEADIGLLAYVLPGQSIIFTPVTLAEARQAMKERMQWLKECEYGIAAKHRLECGFG